MGRVVGKDRAALTRKVESREKVGETLYSSGDYMVAVRWYHRDDADSERLTFIQDDHYDGDLPNFETSASDPRDNGAWDLFNSTELRCIYLNFTEVAGLKPVRRSSRNGGTCRPPPKDTRWRLNPGDEQTIMDANW